MPTQLQLRGGTTAEHTLFVGSPREVTVDTDLKTLRVHDGITAGGTPLAAASDITGLFLEVANNLSDLQSLPATLTNLGLDNVDNTTDLNKPISTLTQTALDGKLAAGGTAVNAELLDTLNSTQFLRSDTSDTFTGTLNITGSLVATGNITAYSDEKLKTNVEVITNALDKVSEVRGVTYTDKETGEKRTGVIAQELQKVLPEAVVEDEEGVLSVAYGNVVGLLIESIKELREEVKALKGDK